MGKWEQVIQRYQAAADTLLTAHEDRVRSGAVVRLDEKGEIFRIYRLRRGIEEQRDACKQVLTDAGFHVSDGSVSWDEEGGRFKDPRFRVRAYGLVRQYQQALEEKILLDMLVRRAEEQGFSRRYPVLAMPGVVRVFQLDIAPVLEYNLLRVLKLDNSAMAMIAALASVKTSIRRSPRLTAALEKKCKEEGEGGSLRVALREELLGAISDLPHVGNQMQMDAEGFSQFSDFQNKVLRQLVRPPGASSREVLATDLRGRGEGAGQGDPLGDVPGGEDPYETVLAAADAQHYKDRVARFLGRLSPQQGKMVKAIRQLEEEKDGANVSDKEIAERTGVPTHTVPNLRQRLKTKWSQSA